METSIRGCVPIFNAAIPRQHLIRVFLAHRPGLVLVCAPPGYGKSVLAGQLARAREFAHTAWVSVPDEDIDSAVLLGSTAQALASTLGTSGCVGSAPTHSDEAKLAIVDALKCTAGGDLCLVLDGCNSLFNLPVLQELTHLIRDATSPDSTVIVTCRGASLHEGAALEGCETWIVEHQDLRFTEREIESLLSLTAPEEVRADRACRLARRFAGHPALTALMLRHADLDDEVSPPRDLVWYVDRLVAMLPDEVFRALYVASLLHEDSMSSLNSALGGQSADSRLASLAPLLCLQSTDAGVSVRFRVHGVMRDSTLRAALVRLRAEETAEYRSRVLDQLQAHGDFHRLRHVLLTECAETEIVQWVEAHGEDMLAAVGAHSLIEILERIQPTTLASRVRLLLVRAATLHATERYAEAVSASRAAACIAEADGNRGHWVECMLTEVRSRVAKGEYDAAYKLLCELRRTNSCSSPTARIRIDLLTAVTEAHTGRPREALARVDLIARDAELIAESGTIDAIECINGLAAVLGMSAGRWSEAARLLALLLARKNLTAYQDVWIRSNMAVCWLELGSLQEAKLALDSVICETEAAGCWHMVAYARATRANVMYALGDECSSRHDYELSQELLTSLGHRDAAAGEQLNAAANWRAGQRYQESLTLAEHVALTVPADGTRNVIAPELVAVEVAASTLALGDKWSARRKASTVCSALADSPIEDVRLRASLVLAEIERIEGQFSAAAQLVSAHSHYIATGSANWLTAMYVRAFPGLLGVLAQALGADNIPLRMLLMIPIETIDAACVMESGLKGEDADVLRRRGGSELMRLAPEPASAVARTHGSSDPAHSCYVRLFGGLEVQTKDGLVDDARWRKRKARLVFAILVLKQRQDVPRDVLLEHLWPDMDEEHAKRNFYVTWSTMKRALACGGSPSAARQYVQCTGGVCRVTREVRSDVDDFDESIAALRAASSAGDMQGTLEAAQRLVGLYRGELLPGDLYEEWFADVRERTKHDFCDAMMCAATIAEGAGDSETALFLLRRAALADPWREDVYQSTMRCQMHAGQRSRAIETYMSCRSRLTEDLGIDPSVETTRIYQSVLAMEEADESLVQYAAE